MSNFIFFNSKVYHTEKALFDDNNKNPDLTYETYIKRLSENNSNSFSFDEDKEREDALNKPLARKKQKVVYNNKEYKSYRELFRTIDEKEKNTDISVSRFINRIKDLKDNNIKNRTDEEIIFIALNANRRESLNLDLKEYELNKAYRNNESKENIVNLLKRFNK